WLLPQTELVNCWPIIRRRYKEIDPGFRRKNARTGTNRLRGQHLSERPCEIILTIWFAQQSTSRGTSTISAEVTFRESGGENDFQMWQVFLGLARQLPSVQSPRVRRTALQSQKPYSDPGRCLCRALWL